MSITCRNKEWRSVRCKKRNQSELLWYKGEFWGGVWREEGWGIRVKYCALLMHSRAKRQGTRRSSSLYTLSWHEYMFIFCAVVFKAFRLPQGGVFQSGCKPTPVQAMFGWLYLSSCPWACMIVLQPLLVCCCLHLSLTLVCENCFAQLF